ncbi:MAG: hypothetical protein PVI57_05175 [Gemmatimonadota bacterium]
MHVLLTDRLTCPRCGPAFGLILLADRVEDRRVYEGLLGCPNCRDQFPVSAGFGDLRAPPRDPLPGVVAGPGTPSDEETTRIAALLGVARGPGNLALVGPVAEHAEGLADLLDDIEVVAVWPPLRERPERPGVSRLAAGPGLPFFSGTLRGVALVGEAADRFLAEAARAVASPGRVVVLDAPDATRERLEALGLSTVLQEPGLLVASR